MRIVKAKFEENRKRKGTEHLVEHILCQNCLDTHLKEKKAAASDSLNKAAVDQTSTVE